MILIRKRVREYQSKWQVECHNILCGCWLELWFSRSKKGSVFWNFCLLFFILKIPKNYHSHRLLIKNVSRVKRLNLTLNTFRSEQPPPSKLWSNLLRILSLLPFKSRMKISCTFGLLQLIYICCFPIIRWYSCNWKILSYHICTSNEATSLEIIYHEKYVFIVLKRFQMVYHKNPLRLSGTEFR